MAVIAGYGGHVTIGSPYTSIADVLHLQEWSGTIETPRYAKDDMNAAGTDKGHAFGFGMPTFRGRIRAHLDNTTPPNVAWFAPGRAAAAIVLKSSEQVTTDQTLSFNGHLNRFHFTVDKQSGEPNGIEAEVVSCGTITPVTGV